MPLFYITGSASSSREKLNGSSDKINKSNSKFKKDGSFTSLPSSSPKKHSFGKTTPPPKPKPPVLDAKNEPSKLVKNDSKSELKAEPKIGKLPKQESKTELKFPKTEAKMDTKMDNFDDLVPRSDNKLAHPTAERVKAPKRRPPSSVFQKEAVSFCYFFSHVFATLTFLRKHQLALT